MSKVSRKRIDVSRQPALETHTYPFCFITLSEPAVSLLGFGGAFLDFQLQLA